MNDESHNEGKNDNQDESNSLYVRTKAELKRNVFLKNAIILAITCAAVWIISYVVHFHFRAKALSAYLTAAGIGFGLYSLKSFTDAYIDYERNKGRSIDEKSQVQFEFFVIIGVLLVLLVIWFYKS